MTSITPFLWFNNKIPEAVAFYKSVFPNAKVETVNDFHGELRARGAEVQRAQWWSTIQVQRGGIFFHQRREPGGGGLFLDQIDGRRRRGIQMRLAQGQIRRSEEHTSELQSRPHLVCRLLLEKK